MSEIKRGLDDTERLNWMIEHQGQLRSPEHGESIELRFIHNGTQHFNGSGVDTPRELIDSCMAQTANTPAPALAAGCQRAHPHEDMNEECPQKTDWGKITPTTQAHYHAEQEKYDSPHTTLVKLAQGIEPNKASTTNHHYASDVESDGGEHD